MGVKSTVFIFSCSIWACLGHPLNPLSFHHNDHSASDSPTQYSNSPHMDQVSTLIAKNFEYPSQPDPGHVIHHQHDDQPNLQRSMQQFPIAYIGEPEQHTLFGGHVHGIGRPSAIPNDVEVINAAHTPSKPSIPFGPNFQDVELVWPGNSGKPVTFPREHGIVGDAQMPVIERRVISEMVPQHFVHMMTDRDGPQMIPVANERSGVNMMPMMVEREMSEFTRDGARPVMMPTMMEVPREMHGLREEMRPVMMVERGSAMEMPREMHGLREEMRPVMMVERDSAIEMPREMHSMRGEMTPLMMAERANNMEMPTEMHILRGEMKPLIMEMPREMDNLREEIRPLMSERDNTMIVSENGNQGMTSLMAEERTKRQESRMLDEKELQPSSSNVKSLMENQLVMINGNDESLESGSMMTSTFDQKNQVKFQEPALLDIPENSEQLMKDQYLVPNHQPTNDDATQPPSTMIPISDSKNEIKNEGISDTDKTLNDAQTQTGEFPDDDDTQETDDKVNEPSSTQTSLLDSKNEIKNKDLAATDKTQNDQPIKTDQVLPDVNPTDKVIEEMSPGMNLFDSKNEIKNKNLAAVDKTQNDQPIKTDQILLDVNPTEKIIEETSPVMTQFDSKNEIKNKDLAATDKTQNDQPLKTDQILLDVNPTEKIIEETSPVMTQFDSKNEIKNKDLAAVDKTQNDQPMKTDQYTQTNDKVIDDSSPTMNLFDSKNEIKNKNLTTVDQTQHHQPTELPQMPSTSSSSLDIKVEEIRRLASIINKMILNEHAKPEAIQTAVVNEMGQSYMNGNPFDNLSDAEKKQPLYTIIEKQFNSLQEALHAMGYNYPPIQDKYEGFEISSGRSQTDLMNDQHESHIPIPSTGISSAHFREYVYPSYHVTY